MQATKTFMDLVMDKSFDTPFEDGEYMVPVKRGREVLAGETERQIQAWKRQKTIGDNIDNVAARELAEKKKSQIDTWAASALTAVYAHVAPQSVEMYDIPEGLAMQPIPLVVQNTDMEDDVRREILLKQQRDQKIFQQEERDEHEASCALRLTKLSAAAVGAAS